MVEQPKPTLKTTRLIEYAKSSSRYFNIILHLTPIIEAKINQFPLRGRVKGLAHSHMAYNMNWKLSDAVISGFQIIFCRVARV